MTSIVFLWIGLTLLLIGVLGMLYSMKKPNLRNVRYISISVAGFGTGFIVCSGIDLIVSILLKN